jgi:hypothetical protein
MKTYILNNVNNKQQWIEIQNIEALINYTKKQYKTINLYDDSLNLIGVGYY